MSLEGKVAVVTGSAGGIGRACAIRLAQDGADVGLLDLKEAELAETKALVEKEGRRCESIAVDLTDREETAAAFARLREALGFDTHAEVRAPPASRSTSLLPLPTCDCLCSPTRSLQVMSRMPEFMGSFWALCPSRACGFKVFPGQARVLLATVSFFSSLNLP